MLDNICGFIKNDEYRITISNHKIHLLNFTAIIDINEKVVYIKINNIILKIFGNNLKLIKLEKQELLITGIIKRIELNE